MQKLEQLLGEINDSNRRMVTEEIVSEKEETIKKLKESRLNSCERRKGK